MCNAPKRSQQCWNSCANGSNIAALRFGDHGTQRNVGSCWLERFTVFKLCARTPGPTTRKNTQQGVQTDATCNIQQCWEFLADNVVTKLQLFHRTCAMVSLWILATEVKSVSDSWKIRKKEDWWRWVNAFESTYKASWKHLTGKLPTIKSRIKFNKFHSKLLRQFNFLHKLYIRIYF